MNSEYLSNEDLNKINFKKIGSNVKISKNVTIIGEENHNNFCKRRFFKGR